MMMGLNTTPENATTKGGVTELDTINIKVSHGTDQHEVAVPTDCTFGDLKSVIAQKIGVSAETHKLLFRGKEKEDDEYLQTAGVKDNAKVLLMEATTSKQNGHEEHKQTIVISRGGEAVAQVKEEVDKLSEHVSALQAVVDSGTKVDNRDIVYVTEMLMRQLLKLDGIEAEGEGRVQRKMEVRRVQSFVETMDIIKSKNSNPFNSVNNDVAVTTQWEAFEPVSESMSATSPVPFSAMPNPVPSSVPNHAVSLASGPMPSSMLSPAAFYMSPPMPYSVPNPAPVPSPVAFSMQNPAQFFAPSPMPSSMPSPAASYTPTPMPSSMPSPAASYTPTQMPSSILSPAASYTPTPMPSSMPNPAPPVPSPVAFPMQSSVPSSSSSPIPSSTKVTQDWERFD